MIRRLILASFKHECNCEDEAVYLYFFQVANNTFTRGTKKGGMRAIHIQKTCILLFGFGYKLGEHKELGVR